MERIIINLIKIIGIIQNIYIIFFIIDNSFKKEIIHLNNYIEEKFFEDNKNFSNYSTKLKPIAIYELKIKFPCEIDNNSDDIYNKERNIEFQKLLNEINIAKSHGIYGFGIYYIFNFQIYNFPLEIIYKNPNINFNYFVILKNYDILDNVNINFYLKYEYTSNDYKNIIESIYKYFPDKRYLKINKNPLLGIYNISQKIILEFISILKKYLKTRSYVKIFTLHFYKGRNPSFNEIFDGYVYIPTYEVIYTINNTKYFSYNEIFYHNLTNLKNEEIYGCSIVLRKNCTQKDIKIYNDYTPYKFYLYNKILINYTLSNLRNKLLFINSFNELMNEHQLNEFGYSSINSLSKAIFNLSFHVKNYNLNKLKNNSLIAIQIHIFFIDLLDEIINKTKNIQVKYDLYITTVTKENKRIIETYIKKNLHSIFFEVLIVDNKGRDVIPFLYQIKRVYKKYKYICHIHSKKTLNHYLGNLWRTYLYNNLLGSPEIINEILSKFETNKKLGFYFPESFVTIKKVELIFFTVYKKYMNLLIKLTFPGKKISYDLKFPSGNMFWGRVSAIYQIFEKFDKIFKYCPREKGQIGKTILHAIERIWVFFVKLNGYYYTTMFRAY